MISYGDTINITTIFINFTIIRLPKWLPVYIEHKNIRFRRVRSNDNLLLPPNKNLCIANNVWTTQIRNGEYLLFMEKKVFPLTLFKFIGFLPMLYKHMLNIFVHSHPIYFNWKQFIDTWMSHCLYSFNIINRNRNDNIRCFWKTCTLECAWKM